MVNLERILPISHPESEHTPPVKVLYVINRFPGFSSDNGGGAERHLQRLVDTSRSQYAGSYHPTVYIASARNPGGDGSVYTDDNGVTMIEDPNRKMLMSTIACNNHPQSILHLSDSYLTVHNPHLYREVTALWQGPIMQRVTLADRIAELKQKMGTGFDEYISPIDSFVSQSDQMTLDLCKLGICREKIIQIENGINCEHKRPLDQGQKQHLRSSLYPGVGTDSKVFLFVGRPTDRSKAIDELIKVWHSNNFAADGHHLTIVGDCGDKDTSKVSPVFETINNLGIDLEGENVHLPGLQPEDTTQEYYQSADVYVQPSYVEGMSNSLLEAMACGLAVIGRSGVSGNSQLILNEQTGLTFSDSDSLTQAMKSLASNGLLVNALACGARQHIVKNHSIERMAEKYFEAYNALIDKHK